MIEYYKLIHVLNLCIDKNIFLVASIAITLAGMSLNMDMYIYIYIYIYIGVILESISEFYIIKLHP